MLSSKSTKLAHSSEEDRSPSTRLLKAARLSSQVYRLDRQRLQWSAKIRLPTATPSDLDAGVIPWIPPLLIEGEDGGRKTEQGSRGAGEQGRKSPTSLRPLTAEAESGEEVEARLDRLRQAQEDLLAQARKEAEELLTTARLEAADLREKARLEGWRQGQAAGLAQGRQEVLTTLQPLSRLLETAAQEVRQNFTDQLAHWEEQIVQWAFAVAEKIITAEIQINRDVVLAAVQDALGRIQGEDILLRVNPEEAPLVQESLDSLAPGVSLRVVADPRIERGGCLVVTSETAVDAQPSVMLQNLRLALIGED